jgi:hypothetical protein
MILSANSALSIVVKIVIKYIKITQDCGDILKLTNVKRYIALPQKKNH